VVAIGEATSTTATVDRADVSGMGDLDPARPSIAGRLAAAWITEQTSPHQRRDGAGLLMWSIGDGAVGHLVAGTDRGQQPGPAFALTVHRPGQPPPLLEMEMTQAQVNDRPLIIHRQ
jgi:hypothetical protein